MKSGLYAACAMLACSAAMTGAHGGSGNEMAEMYGELGVELPDGETAARQAAQYPLGSFENPVRASRPPGQRAYLSRLRCSDGTAPAFRRTGNLGIGAYGYIVDNYAVDCGEADPGETNIVMDMYHDHVETKAVSGFTIVEP